MPAQANVFKKQISIDWLVAISIFVFFSGAACAILVCGHYAHDPLAPVSGSAAEPTSQDQIKRLEQEASADPSKTKALIELGNLYYDNGQYEQAMDTYGQALERDPNNADFRIDLGALQRLTGQPLEAVASFDQVVSQDPNNETALLYKAIVLKEDFNDPQEAAKVLEKTLGINPSAMVGPDQSVQELVRLCRDRRAASDGQP